MDLAHNSVYCIQCILYAYDMPDDVLYCTTRTIYYVCHPICMLFVKKNTEVRISQRRTRVWEVASDAPLTLARPV